MTPYNQRHRIGQGKPDILGPPVHKNTHVFVIEPLQLLSAQWIKHHSPLNRSTWLSSPWNPSYLQATLITVHRNHGDTFEWTLRVVVVVFYSTSSASLSDNRNTLLKRQTVEQVKTNKKTKTIRCSYQDKQTIIRSKHWLDNTCINYEACVSILVAYVTTLPLSRLYNVKWQNDW
jgi:hypothetical protein